MLFFSLYIISNRLCFLRSCKVAHSSCSIMLLTDKVLWYRLVTYRAALLWTISNRWISFCWYESHTELAYSRVGLTKDTYTFSLIDLLEMFMFFLRKLMVLLALEQMVLICLPNLRSDEMVHPSCHYQQRKNFPFYTLLGSGCVLISYSMLSLTIAWLG